MRKYTIEKKVSTYFLVCEGLSIDDVGVSRDTVFQEIRPVAGYETADFVIEKLGGIPQNEPVVAHAVYRNVSLGYGIQPLR